MGIDQWAESSVDLVIDLHQLWWKPNTSHQKPKVIIYWYFFLRFLLPNSFILLQLLWVVSEKKKLNQEIFIHLWHGVQRRQKHVNRNGPPIWFRNKSAGGELYECEWIWSLAACVIHQTQHESTISVVEKSTVFRRLCSISLVTFFMTLELITYAPPQPKQATILLSHIVQKISVFMLVNHKAAEANRLHFFCLSFYCLMRSSHNKNPYPRTKRKSNFYNSKYALNFCLRQRISRCHQLFQKTNCLFSTLFDTVTTHLNCSSKKKNNWSHCAIFINGFLHVISTYNHVGYLHLSLHS